MSHLNRSEWQDFGHGRSKNGNLFHAGTAHFEAHRQSGSVMGLNNNKAHLGENGRSPTVFVPWISQVEAASFATESGSYIEPAYSHGDGDSWTSFIFSPEHMDYRLPSQSVPECTPPLLYDTAAVTLGPIVDCSGVADLIFDKVSTAHLLSRQKDSSSSTRIILPPPPAAPVKVDVTATSSRLSLDTFGTLKNANVATESLLQTGKNDGLTTSNFLSGYVNWDISDTDGFDPCANKEPNARIEQRMTAAMHEAYLRNYRKGRHPDTITMPKSDHTRRERDRRIALKLMYKTLDSMIPKASKKSKRDRTAIVEDALQYVKGLQEKLEKLRGKSVGAHKSLTHKPIDPGQEYLKASSTFEVSRFSRDVGSQDQECMEADSLLGSEPKVSVFIGCGNEVLINISCRPRAKLVSCVLEAFELLSLDVEQYSFCKLLEQLVHCNFRVKQKEASEKIRTRQMIEEVLKPLLK